MTTLVKIREIKLKIVQKSDAISNTSRNKDLMPIYVVSILSAPSILCPQWANKVYNVKRNMSRTMANIIITLHISAYEARKDNR